MKNDHPFSTLIASLVLVLGMLAPEASAQIWGSRSPNAPMRKASDMIGRQPGPKINKELESVINPSNSRVVVSLSKQRVYLMTGDQIYIDSPISSGKAGHSTPQGNFSIMEKDADHRSSVYGNFVDRNGRIVRAGVSTKIDSAPSGTRYQGAPMKWFCRLTSSGVGMHIGILPGYPASHGCIRLPAEIAPIIYSNVRVGTKVLVEA
ncbi:MAG: L,D-transpeptidase family protein [Chthoniobacter sp.]|nr:L,D-transpeptidase family protein [Chthoniobacter sp.]